MPETPVISNAGPMSEFVGAFEVRSRLTGHVYHCRFSHLWNGIATRHADTIDCKFFVDGTGVVVGLAHTALVAYRERAGRSLNDRELSFVAAEYLKEKLEEEIEHSLYNVPAAEVTRLLEKLGIR